MQHIRIFVHAYVHAYVQAHVHVCRVCCKVGKFDVECMGRWMLQAQVVVLAEFVVCHGQAGLEWPTNPTLFTLAMYLRWGGLSTSLSSRCCRSMFFLDWPPTRGRLFGLSSTTRRSPAEGGLLIWIFWRFLARALYSSLGQPRRPPEAPKSSITGAASWSDARGSGGARALFFEGSKLAIP